MARRVRLFSSTAPAGAPLPPCTTEASKLPAGDPPSQRSSDKPCGAAPRRADAPRVDAAPRAPPGTTPAPATGAGALSARRRFLGSGMPPLRLLIVRHAQSANKVAQCPSPDPGLSEAGCDQAGALGARLAEEFWRADERGGVLVVSSPMRRCLLTILPAVRQLSLAPEQCLCHGGCFEYGCAGARFAGSTEAEIADAFPEFRPVGFSGEGTWDYRGSNAKEDEADCLARAGRITEWLWHDAVGYLRPRAWGASTATIILCAHRTISDLLCQLLVDGTSRDWAYGDTKYSLHNAGMTEVFLHPDGGAKLGVVDDHHHVGHLRRQLRRTTAATM